MRCHWHRRPKAHLVMSNVNTITRRDEDPFALARLVRARLQSARECSCQSNADAPKYVWLYFSKEDTAPGDSPALDQCMCVLD